ncbi:DNA helicase [Listeria welshimeri]|nr:DNA helicase [Listeria welshimeri]MBC2354827.1 DNA helicase [Listeria welshimeri]MBC6158689.1 DNA helicase [Listeria welshimeri]
MKTKQLKAMEIIEFWRLIEFLNQKAFPIQNTEDRKVQLARMEEINQSKLTVFEEVTDQQTIKEKIKDNEKLNEQLPITSSDFHIVVGRMQRKIIIDTLYQKFKGKETVENNTENIAMFALKVNSEGLYIKESLRLSPLLWGMTICCHYPNKLKTKLKLEEYYKTMAIIEAEFFSEKAEENNITSNKLKKLFNYILKFFVNEYVSVEQRNGVIYDNKLIYTRFKNQKEFDKYNDTLEDYSELMMSFFQSDFDMVLNKLETIENQADFINYVTALYGEINQKEQENKRKDIRQNDNLLVNILDPLNSPKGKWPSKHSPVLMQQVAINAYLQHEEKIFSVNGPPGTGKTTLLKELIANNVVERAAMLAEYKKADDAFNTHLFKDGGKKYKSYDNEFNHFYELKNNKINDFNLLVASSNNAAVENITKDLPDYTNLMDGIDSKETSEINKLFDQHKQDTELSFRVKTSDEDNKVKSKVVKRKDIYFTLLAHLLKHNNDSIENKETLAEWGLISAPLGKRANLSNYYYQVIMPIINCKTASKKDYQAEFEKFKYKFKKQYQKVQDIQLALHEISKFKKRKNSIGKPLNREEKSVYADIKTYLEKIDYLKKEAMIVSYELKQFLPTLKHDYFQFEREKSKLVFLKKDTSILQEKMLRAKKQIANLEDGKKLHEKVFNRFLKTQRLVGIRQLKQEVLDLREQEKLAIITERKQGGIIAYQKETLLEQEQNKVILENKSQKYHSDISFYEKQILLKQSELIKLQAESESKRLKAITRLEADGMIILNEAFLARFHGENTTIQLEAQLANPWITKEYDREREKLFYLALQVNKYFVLTSKKVKSNLVNLGYLWNFKKNSDKEFCYFSNRDRKNCFKALLNTIFLVTPVISTTFASVSRFLADVEEPESLGQLIIDEAGQSTPQMAVGALWRFKKAIVVGDPKQVEPVVTEDVKLLLELFAREEFSWYKSKAISVQTFADSLNYIGSFLSSNDRNEKQWVGCPLVIHRRCLNPMFAISNELAYDNTMLFQTTEPKDTIAKNLVGRNSLWISIVGNEVGNKNHHVSEHAKKAVTIVERAFEKQNGPADMYIISPFASVIRGFMQEAKKSTILKKYAKSSFELWINTHCGTVHKFQGKEAGEVIFLLGCDASAMGAVNWVNENMVNVAVTRAKYRLYVIGDANVWKKNPSLLVVQNRLEIKSRN